MRNTIGTLFVENFHSFKIRSNNFTFWSNRKWDIGQSVQVLRLDLPFKHIEFQDVNFERFFSQRSLWHCFQLGESFFDLGLPLPKM